MTEHVMGLNFIDLGPTADVTSLYSVFARIINRLGPMAGEVMKVYHTPNTL